MDGKITIYKIAEELNMSPSMVSRAFSENGKVNPEKRAIILETAAKYNYSPNKFASRLSMKTVRIGVVLKVRFDLILHSLIKGIENAYVEMKDYKIVYDMTVINSGEKTPEECFAEFEKYKDYDGVILCGFGSRKYSDIIKRFEKLNHNIVQLQNCNDEVNSLFSSKHNEAVAAEMAVEFLSNCLKYSTEKGVLLFTGSIDSAVHSNAKSRFVEVCAEYGLNILECLDMRDDENVLEEIAVSALEKYGSAVKGIYITSGFSMPLCRYVHEKGLDVNLVTFDVYPKLAGYIENGTVNATIYQDIKHQAYTAFSELVRYLIFGDAITQRVIYTNVELMMRSNIGLLTDVAP